MVEAENFLLVFTYGNSILAGFIFQLSGSESLNNWEQNGKWRLRTGVFPIKEESWPGIK